jgi:hypothetical protein
VRWTAPVLLQGTAIAFASCLTFTGLGVVSPGINGPTYCGLQPMGCFVFLALFSPLLDSRRVNEGNNKKQGQIFELSSMLYARN